MTDLDLVIRAARGVLPGGERGATIGVKGGVITVVEPQGADLTAPQVIDLADDEVLLPGVVDSHVHVNDPGRTDWEGFTSATRAAAAGGVTTLIDMPLNSIPPTVTVDALEIKRKVAVDQAFIDVGFWGGAVPGNVPDLRPLHEQGVFGFKCFLLHSGVDEFPPLTPDEVEAAMREIQSFDGLLIVHAEDSHSIDGAPQHGGTHYRDFLTSRPREAENLAIKHVIEGARRTGCRVHILHVSSSDALPMIAAARKEGVQISTETCPHYLSFTAEDIPDGATQFKCCPPIRESDNRDALWEGLRDGTIDQIVSDHSPSTIDLKNLETGDFGTAWGGISSLQLGLAAIWTQARERGFDLTDVSRWMSQAPARQTRLQRKGRIEVGQDADFAVFAPDETFVVDVKALHHKNAITPYAGRTLSGVVRKTILRGRTIDIDADPQGKLIVRGEA
ncbi:allantoinase AllB [Leekyejoonella antrihumi]|uniref:allantoinase n=1 Tax=Leekyejoonella antrihumi TaxID=1660198 RepID=A0A563DYV0_9MICO|nr:allantoinase AllB [Leekyejoonella antrihumi]TWP35438.1 allantoinase AllB [Leekyejoonella antrihumi]